MTMSRYAYDYSLTPARPTGWRATLATITVVGTVMAISGISGALVTLHLFTSQDPAVAAPRVAANSPAPWPVAARFGAQATRTASAPATRSHAEPTATVAAAPAAPHAAATQAASVHPAPHAAPPVVAPPVVAPPVVASSSPPPAAAPVTQPPPASAALPDPAAIPDKDLTFAKGYAQRHAIASGAVVRHGKVVVAAQAQLGRAAPTAKPRVVARNKATSPDRRRADTARSDAYGMFQRFDRPDQFDFNRHQALAFGEQHPARRRNDPPPARQSRSPNGLFGGLF